MSRQCELLGLSRSTYYYRPAEISPQDVELMGFLDAVYTDYPFYGVRRMVVVAQRDGWDAGPKRVRRLLRHMGLHALYPKPDLSKPAPGHRIYPYLLRGVRVTKPNHVWSADITYIPLRAGFAYLVAVIDWASRYVVSWRLSTNLDSSFCVEALDEALSHGRPAVFNTDQGSQFTSSAFTSILEDLKIAISMDGRGRALDNVFVERLWRTVKYEDVYLKDYQTPNEARQGLGKYLHFYNHERPHSALDYRVPAEVHNRATATGTNGQRR